MSPMRSAPLLLAALLLVPACGGSSDPASLTDSGYKALAIGDYGAAAGDFEQALEAIGVDATHASFGRAKIGAIEAYSQTDAARARSEFLAFAESHPDQLTDRDYNRIAGRLGDAGNLEEAIALLEAGKAAYPESTHLDALGARLVEQASQSGDSGALDALKGLGYVGD